MTVWFLMKFGKSRSSLYSTRGVRHRVRRFEFRFADSEGTLVSILKLRREAQNNARVREGG